MSEVRGTLWTNVLYGIRHRYGIGDIMTFGVRTMTKYKVSCGDYKPYIAQDINDAIEYVMRVIKQQGYNLNSVLFITPIK